MLTHNNKHRQILFHQLAYKLIKSSQWQLINSITHNTMFKQKRTHKIFKLLHLNEHIMSLYDEDQDYGDKEMQMLDCAGHEGIFMQIIKVSQEYYLYQKPIISLHRKMFVEHSHRARITFGQNEILNTFIPILESLVSNKIPSYYQMNSYNIVIDSQQNVRLTHPLLTQNDCRYTGCAQSDLYTQIAFIILEATLLLPIEDIQILSEDQQKLIIALLQKEFSYKTIGLVIILFNEIRQNLSINLKQCLEANFEGPWFELLKRRLTEISDLMGKKSQEITSPQKNNKTARKHFSRYDEEIEDSHHQTLAKYRNGKRLINKIFHEDSASDDTESGLKPKKDKVK